MVTGQVRSVVHSWRGDSAQSGLRYDGVVHEGGGIMRTLALIQILILVLLCLSGCNEANLVVFDQEKFVGVRPKSGLERLANELYLRRNPLAVIENKPGFCSIWAKFKIENKGRRAARAVVLEADIQGIPVQPKPNSWASITRNTWYVTGPKRLNMPIEPHEVDPNTYVVAVGLFDKKPTSKDYPRSSVKVKVKSFESEP